MKFKAILPLIVMLACALAPLAAQLAAQTEKSEKSQPKEPPQARDGVRDDGRPVTDLRQFMRAKLAASNKILEGLATDDLALVKDGARSLNKMSLSEKWRANNDVMYKQFSAEFQRVTTDLIQAAEDGNEDLATLKWMGAMMACIECHRFVRSTLVVDQDVFQ